MAVQTQLPTLADYQRSFDEQPVEIIDGEIIKMSPHGRRQPRVIGQLLDSLRPYVSAHKLGEALPEASYVLDADRRKDWVRNARTPDCSFITQDRIDAHDSQYSNPDEPWWLAPDLAVEVISPTDEPQDVNRRLKDYLTFGVRIVWLVYPKTRTVVVYTPEQPLGTTLTERDNLTAEPVIVGWSMPVAALFAE